MTDIFRGVAEIIAAHCSVDAATLTPATRLEDLDVQSLDLVEIVFEIEERFGIEVPPNADAGSRLEFTTIGEIVVGVKSILDQPKTP
jgi:acyl carrier protein